MSNKAKSKIAKGEARACADDLVSSLQSAGAAKALAANLVRDYTVGARTLIIEQAVELAAGKRQSTFDEDIVEPFIKDFIATPKPKGLDKLILGLAKFADAALANRGKGWGLGVVAVELGNAEQSPANMQNFEALGESLRSNDDYLAESLAYIVDSEAPSWAVRLWECLARPAIGDLSRPYSISPKGTSKIVEEISKLEPDLATEGLPLLIPLLLDHSDPDSRDRFLATSIGKSFRKNLLNTHRKAERDDEKSPDPLLREDDRQILDLIRQRLLDKNREFESLLEEAESKHLQKLADYQGRLRQAHSENSRLSGQLRRSEDNISQLKSSEEQHLTELEAKDKELAGQAAEIRHLEREKKNQEVDQSDRHQEALQKKLVEPAATVRDLVIEISEPTTNSKIEPRVLAVAFDALHRRILNLAKVEDDRIPRHILAGKKK